MDQKTDIPGIYRSSDGILINKDNNALLAYKKAKEKNKEMENLREEVSTIKSELTEIKELLKGLVK